MFSRNEAAFTSSDDLAVRRAMRLLFEGKASPETALLARATILSLTGFYNTAPSERPSEAVLEARRIMASIIDYTYLSVPEIDAMAEELHDEGLSYLDE